MGRGDFFGDGAAGSFLSAEHFDRKELYRLGIGFRRLVRRAPPGAAGAEAAALAGEGEPGLAGEEDPAAGDGEEDEEGLKPEGHSCHSKNFLT